MGWFIWAPPSGEASDAWIAPGDGVASVRAGAGCLGLMASVKAGCLAHSTADGSPSSATMMMAAIAATPRSACTAATIGASDHLGSSLRIPGMVIGQSSRW